MGSRTAPPRRTRRRASRATPPPAAAPSAPACPPPPDPAPQPAHPDQERRNRAATNRNAACRCSPPRTWVKRSEPKKPARKKREQERSTTGSRSRVRISPTPPAPPAEALMTPPPFIPRARCLSSDAYGSGGEDDPAMGGEVARDLASREEAGGRPL